MTQHLEGVSTVGRLVAQPVRGTASSCCGTVAPSSAARKATARSPNAMNRVSQSMPELEPELESTSAAMSSVARPEIVMTDDQQELDAEAR